MMKEINSITLEIIANGMVSIAEQMGVTLTKTGYSTNIKEKEQWRSLRKSINRRISMKVTYS